MLDPRTLVLVVLSAVGGFLGSLGHRLLPFEGIVDNALMNCCGLKASTQALWLRWPLGLEARGGALKAKQNRPVLTARRLVIQAHARDLLLAPRRLESLSLSGVSVYLRRNEKGVWNIAGLLAQGKPQEPAVGLRHLSVKGLRLVVEDHTQRPVLHLTQNVRQLNTRLDQLPGRLPIDAEVNDRGQKISLRAQLTPRGWSASRFQLTVGGYPVTEAVKLVPLGWLTPLPGWALPTGGTLRGQLKSDGGGLRGRFDLKGVRRGRSVPLAAQVDFALSPRAVTIQKLIARGGRGEARLTLSCQRPIPAAGGVAAANLPCVRGRTAVSVKNFPLQSVAAFLPWPFAKDLAGELTGEVSAEGNPSDLPGLTGRGGVTLTGGRVLGLTVGGPPLAVSVAVARGEVKEGSVNLSRLFFQSAPMGLDLSGRVGLDGALDLSGKARLERKRVLKGARVFLAPLLKDKGRQMEFRLRVGGTVSQPELSPQTLATLSAGIQDQFKDVGNETETAGRNLGNVVEDAARDTANQVERLIKKLF